MNFMGKVNNTSHGYYEEDHHNNNLSTPSMVIPSSSSTTLVLSPNSHENQYFYAGASSRSAEPELDLMDISPLHPPSDQNRNNNNDSDNYSETSTVLVVEREYMFDKVVTPSDVGKLNRLVIPKQHAEKYFPLDSTSNDNKQGLLLNFEDSNGKTWRFRYSYWNSSQSYVMTKGWSRFVKDKKLDAGDIVSFHRGLGHQAKDRLFIHWRRRPPPPPDHMPFSAHHNFSLLHPPQYPHHYFPGGRSRSSPVEWSGVPSGTGLYLPAHASRPGGDNYYPTTGYNNVVYGYGGTNNASTSTSHDDLLNNNNNHPRGNSVIYFKSAGAGSTVAPQYSYQQQASLESEMMRFSSGSSGEFRGGGREHVFESVPVVQGKATAKRLRLFGVNMDCPISHEDDDEDEDHDVTILPSTTTTIVLLPH